MKRSLNSGSVHSSVYSCVQAGSENTFVIPFCLIFFLLFFSAASNKFIHAVCFIYLAVLLTALVIIAVCGFKLTRDSVGKLNPMTTHVYFDFVNNLLSSLKIGQGSEGGNEAHFG